MDPVEIRTDSQYVVKGESDCTVLLTSYGQRLGMNEWIHSWIRNGWKKPVENRDLFERLHELRSRRPVLFVRFQQNASE